MGYLFPEDDPANVDTGVSPSTPTLQPLGGTTNEGGYLFPEDDPEYAAPPPVQQLYPYKQQPPQSSTQLFPAGQDHVAREVLGLQSKPYQRSEILPESHFGILGDFGSGLASGVLQTGEMALRAARAFDAPGGIDMVRDATTAGIETIRGWEDEYPRIFKPSEDTGDSWFRNAVYGGMKGIIPSMTFGGLGAVAGSFVGSPLVGFALGAGGVFAASEYDQFMEDAESNGIPRSEAQPYAIASALVEGLGEGVADYLGGRLLGIKGLAIEPFKTTIKKMMKISGTTMAKNMLKQLPVEVGTEMAQGGSQTFLRNLAGMDAGNPWKTAVESIGPAMVMTMAFGVAGAGKQSIQLRNARKVLEDGDANPVQRKNAADFVTFHLNKVDKNLAELWRFNTDQYIKAGYGIPIDRKTSEYLAWGESSEYSPQLAEDLEAGKDIKLLPAPERGFILVDEPYNPDDRADYDTYSPEFAKKIKEHTETLALPPGQDFTMDGKTYTAYSPTLREAKIKKEEGKAPKKLPAPPVEFESELTDEGELVRTPVERPLEPLALPPGEGFVREDLTPEEAAARGVESALETGTPEEVERAARELGRRQKAPAALTDRVPALVRRTLKANPNASIGDVYRSVKAKDKTANRQDVAKLVRQEKKLDFPTTKKGLKAELDSLGQEDFNHFYNPVNLEARLIQAMTDQGVSREDAKAQVRPMLVDYAKNYEAVNKEALAKIEKAKAPKVTKKAEKPKEAAEAVKKEKAKPKPKKPKLKAQEPKKAAKPLKKKPSAADQVAAMEKPKKEPKTDEDIEAPYKKAKGIHFDDRVVTPDGPGIVDSKNGLMFRVKLDTPQKGWENVEGYAPEYHVDQIEHEAGQVVETTVREVPKKLEHKPKKKAEPKKEKKPKEKVRYSKRPDVDMPHEKGGQVGLANLWDHSIKGITSIYMENMLDNGNDQDIDWLEDNDVKTWEDWLKAAQGGAYDWTEQSDWSIEKREKILAQKDSGWPAALKKHITENIIKTRGEKVTKKLKAKAKETPKLKAKPKAKAKAKDKPVTKIRKKGTAEAQEREEARQKLREEKEEIKPSDIRANAKVETPDGKGTVVESPQPDQWIVKMTDGWAKGDELVFATSELVPEGTLKAKTKGQAKLGKPEDKRDPLVMERYEATPDGDGGMWVGYLFKRGGKVAGEMTLELTGELAYVDWMEHNEREFGKLTPFEIRKILKQIKTEWPSLTKLEAFRVYTHRTREQIVSIKLRDGKPKELFNTASAEDFVKARDKNKRIGFLSQTPAEDLKNHKIFLSSDGHTGYAIAPDGDLQMLFSNVEAPRGQGTVALRHAIANGATKLDAFDGWLVKLYKEFGFEETGRVKWDDQYAPVGWDYAQYGRPDVVFMALKGDKNKADMRGRSSKSIARQAEAQREQGYIRVIRQAFPTATEIASTNELDVFDVALPNGSKIQVRINGMPEDLDIAALQKNYARDITGEVPLGLWVPGPNVTITGEGVIWLAGFGELQRDVDHEAWHAAKSIALNAKDEAQLEKDYPGTAQTQDEREAEAYDEWATTERSHEIFDKVRVFFRQIAEQYGIGKGKSYRIFRTVINGKVWHRPIGKVSTRGRLYDSIASLKKELPRFKKRSKAAESVRANREDIFHDRDHWETVGAVLYIEGLSGKAWTEEMRKQLLEHYNLDKVPPTVMSVIRKDSQHIFEKRSVETLSGKLPTLEALMQMEQRGAAEGGIVWYDEQDGLSTIAKGPDGEYVARSARSELEEYFGEDAELMAGLIAHLSSGLQVPLNTQKAIEVYIAHKMDIGFKGTYQVTRKSIDEFFKTRKTSGPKREPFYNAIMGDADAIVIDRWMARVLDFRTKNAKTGEYQTSVGATEKQRELLIEWVRRGAKRLGISNRAYQAMIWAGKKAIDEEASGRPTGSLEPLAKVIEEKVKLKGILAKDIPEGKEDEYFILKGMDRWAIHKDSFLPLADLELFTPKVTRKPNAINVPNAPVQQLTAEEKADLEKQQGQLFARMSNNTIVEDSLDDVFGGKQKGLLQKLKDGIKRFKDFRTLVLDEFHPILKHLGDRVYKLHRMLNGVHASVEAMMRHGKLRLDEDGNIVADGRDRGFAVWAKKHGKDAVNVLRWAAAKRSEQLEKDNPEWLQNEEFLTEAKRERIYRDIGAAPEGGGTWESLHAEFDEFHQSVLDIAEKAGIIDEVVREDWRDLIYVPFYRVFEDTATREEYLANPKKAKDIAAKVKPIKGSARKIGEPIENVIANWGYMIQESMRNQARAEAYVNAKMLNEIGDLMRDVDYQEIKHTIVNDKGVITYETEKGDDMVLSFLENGKRKYFAVHDADLYYALTTMNAQHFGKLFNAFFGGPKRLLTYGATFGPAFRVANAVRDTLHTWMITPGMSFTPFLSTAKGFISAMREDEHYVAALAAGGLHGGSYVHAEDPASMSKFTKRLLGKQAKGTVTLDTLGKVLEFWDRIGAASENAARVQLHRQLLEKGESGLEAAYQARDLLDFALKGQSSIVLALIRTIPFLGARTQGNYRLARAAIDPKTRWTMPIKGAILAAASLALWSAFKDDERYKELEDYDKWTYYHWWIGDQHFRMPKPFEVGAIFSSMFESAANTMTDNEEMEFMIRFFKHTFTETFAVGVPQTVKPLAELWANKSFFTGRPIEGRAMKLLEPGERAEPWTSETLQLLGKGLNISPKKMEALMRGYLATISTFALGGTDMIARWVGDFPERPKYRSDDYPLVGRFWKQGPARNTKYATRIYELMEESDRLVQTVKHYMIEGDMKRAEKLADSNLGLFSANKMLNRIRKKMTTLRRVMKDVERDRTMTREEKKAEIDELTVARNQLVREVYEVLREEIK